MDKAAHCLRKQVAEFSDDLTQADIKRLFFLYQVPQGIQERLRTAVEVFQHLESRAFLDFNDSKTVVKLMRELNREKWAKETEKKFEGLASSNNIQAPEQESRQESTTSTIQHTATHPDSLQLLTMTTPTGVESPQSSSTPIIIRREPQSPITRLSNSLKRRMRLHNDDLTSVDHSTAGATSSRRSSTGTTSPSIEDLTQHRMSLFPPTPELSFGSNYCIVDPVEEEMDPRLHAYAPMVHFGEGRQQQQQPLSRLTRKPSKMSNHSSGYYSGVWDPSDIDDEEEDSFADYYQRHREFFSPCSGSRRSTLGSLSSSAEDYLTADDSDSDQGTSEPSSLSPDSQLPPSMQSLECGIEVQVKELQVERSCTGSVIKSPPFPSFNINRGITFQIHLYPVSLCSTSSCAVYLVVLGWRDERSQHLPKFDINVTVSKGKDVIRSEEVTVDVMKDSLPPTPNNVNHVNIALFPSLLSRSELNQLESKSVFIKATLKY